MTNRIDDAVVAAIPEASVTAMERLRQVAAIRTSLDSSDLRTSAYVAATPEGADVVYDSVYARYQHYEILHHEVGEWLYLTTSLINETPAVIGILAEELGKAIDG